MRNSARISLMLLAALLAGSPAKAQQAAEARPLPPAVSAAVSTTVRHALVKAVGQGRTSEEAERAALKNARALAAARYAHLGGAAALSPDPEHAHILAAHHSPPMGFAEIRATVLVEFRLRPMMDHLDTGAGQSRSALPSLAVRLLQHQHGFHCWRTLDHDDARLQPDGQAPELLPGGGGGSWRLVPGRALRQPLPRQQREVARPGSRLHVLACTGGLNAPPSAATATEALLRARAGRPRPAMTQGVISDCVQKTLRLGPAASSAANSATGLARSLDITPQGQDEDSGN